MKTIKLTESQLKKLVNKILKEDTNTQPIKRIWGKYGGDQGFCSDFNYNKIYPYDEDVLKVQQEINQTQGETVVKEDGKLGPKTKDFICSKD